VTPSARGLACLVAAVGVVLIPSSAMGQQQVRIQFRNDLAGDGLTWTTPDHPGFAEEVRRLLKEEEFEWIKPVLPQSVIVRNETGGYLSSLTVLYRYPEFLSTDGVPMQIPVSPAAVVLERSYMAEPGAKFILTPVPNLYWSFKGNGDRAIWPMSRAGDDGWVNWYLQEHGSYDVVVSLDSLVHEDGTLVGPDLAGRLETLNARLRADREIFREVSRLSGDALVTYLQSASAAYSTDAYTMRLSERAQTLLEDLLNKGSGAFDATLAGMKKQDRIEVYRRVKRGAAP
jgi:hypothetical protein